MDHMLMHQNAGLRIRCNVLLGAARGHDLPDRADSGRGTPQERCQRHSSRDNAQAGRSDRVARALARTSLRQE